MRSATKQLKVKTVGKNGQAYIGKRYAGRQVLVDTSDPNIIVVTVISDKERSLHKPETADAPRSTMEWGAATTDRTQNKN